MPRFSIKQMLLAFAVIALWMSTLSGYPGSDYVQLLIRLSVLLAAGFGVIYGTGKRRAFSVGFLMVMLLILFKPNAQFMPSYSWAQAIILWNMGLPDLGVTNTTPADRFLFQARFTMVT